MPKKTFFNLKPEKRQLIEQAALAEFSEYGAKGASLNRLVRAAGIAKGSFYQYFDDMDDLLTHLILQFSQRKLAAIEQGLTHRRDADFYTKLGEIYRAAIRFLAKLTPQEMHFVEQIATAAQLNSQRINDYRQQTLASLLRPMVVDAVDKGEITVDVNLAYAVVSQFGPMFSQYLSSIRNTRNPVELFAEGQEFNTAFKQIMTVIKAGLSIRQAQENKNV